MPAAVPVTPDPAAPDPAASGPAASAPAAGGPPARGAARCGLAEGAVRTGVVVSWTTATTAAAVTSMTKARNRASPGRRSRGIRRAVHRLMVVARTRPHEGSRGGVTGAFRSADLTTSVVRLVLASCMRYPASTTGVQARDLRKNTVTTVSAGPVRYLSETADHTRVSLSTGMPDCVPRATVRSSINRLMAEPGEDHYVAQVAARRPVEDPAAGDQAQLSVGDGPVHRLGREPVLGVHVLPGYGEDRHRPVGAPHVYLVAWLQRPQPEEDPRPGLRIHMPGDD